MGLHVTSRVRLFVIGGGSVYHQAISFADEMYLTYVEKAEATEDLFGDRSFNADTFFPRFDDKEWLTCHVSRHYRALDSLKAPADVRPTHYFRFWKLARRSIGCTPSESRHLMSRFGSTQLELPFWDHAHLAAQPNSRTS